MTGSPRRFLCGRRQEYGIPGPLLQAIRSLYEHSESSVHILSIKLSVFLVEPRPVVCPAWEPQDYISALCR